MLTTLLRFLLLILAAPTFAAEPTTQPILRIESGMHTTKIGHIATDAQGHYLVTTSNDKTARVWDIATGRLLNTLRPPQDAGNEGKLYAVALSPDGNTVAVGGWTGWDWDGNAFIYLFDRSSGTLRQRISGLGNAIKNLAWSPDGRYLAASLLGNNGIRVYRTDTYQEVGRDNDYGSDSYGTHFSRDNRLVASSYDGALRLYQVNDNGLRLLAKQSAPGGPRPEGVRFSPDGQQIAVGFDGSSQVNVLDGRSLNFLFAPDTSAVTNGKLSSFAWSDDGRSLFAGGVFQQNAKFSIVHWSQGGRGQAEFRNSGAKDTLMDFAALPDGSLLFGAADPAWGQLSANGTALRKVSSGIADYRDNHAGFALSYDGVRVNFGFEVFGKSPAHFDLQTGLSLGTDSGLSAPRWQAAGLEITDWKYTTAPKLNGVPLKLQQYEQAQSLAIAPDGERFALGASWAVRLFDRNGAELWQVPAPGTAWAVNISGDGRYVVAALGDGTIRWYGMADGKEVLAFFPHADKKRWVAWTPSGYYTASPGGEELIGWHLNRGKDAAADFFPASRFRNQFYRPDVLAKVLETGNEAEALRLANAASGRKTAAPVAVQTVLPPVVSVVSPAEGSTVSANTVTVRYQTRSPEDAPVTAIRVRVNGQAVSAARALKRVKSGEAQEVTVTIPAQDSEIQLFAENKNGVSTPATLRVKWAGKPAEAGFSVKPKLYVLAVGVSKYDNPDYTLGFAAKDARDFAAALQKQKGKLYREVEVRLLTDKQATRDQVLEGLDWLSQQVTQHDVGMLFVAGHGVNDSDGTYYYMPVNADADRVRRTGVEFVEIKRTLANLAGKALFFIDTCHSGNVLGGRRAVNAYSTDAVVSELASAENGVVVFSSSTGKQFSLENTAWGNGAFTKALIEGLSGKADYQHNGRITHKQLDYYLSERVKELTNGKQTPVSQAPGGVPDFPVALTQ